MPRSARYHSLEVTGVLRRCRCSRGVSHGLYLGVRNPDCRACFGQSRTATLCFSAAEAGHGVIIVLRRATGLKSVHRSVARALSRTDKIPTRPLELPTSHRDRSNGKRSQHSRLDQERSPESTQPCRAAGIADTGLQPGEGRSATDMYLSPTPGWVLPCGH
jgi:hypothetical protein